MPLTDILQALIDKTVNLEGAGDDIALPHGLHVHLRLIGDDSFMLTIWRFSVDPSAQEWNTVVAHWPYPLGTINWTNSGVTENGKHFKQAEIVKLTAIPGTDHYEEAW